MTDIETAIKRVLEARADYQTTCTHLSTERALTDFEITSLDESTRNYRIAVIQTIDILFREIKGLDGLL